MLMKLTRKYMALFVGLAVVASLGSTYAAIQANQSTNGVQDDNMKTMGHVTLAVYGVDGGLKAYRQTDNLVVSNGDNATVNTMFGVSRTTTSGTIGQFKAVAVGTGSTGPFTTDTALGTQVGHKIIGTTSIATAQRGNVVVTAIFNPGKVTNSTAAVTEAGIFDNTVANPQSNSTNMFARQTFSAISIGSTDTLTITWTVNIT